MILTFSDCTADTPKAHVFNTAELREMIMLHLPDEDILGSARTCQGFASTIDTSVKIKRKLFLLPQPERVGGEIAWVIDKEAKIIKQVPASSISAELYKQSYHAYKHNKTNLVYYPRILNTMLWDIPETQVSFYRPGHTSEQEEKYLNELNTAARGTAAGDLFQKLNMVIFLLGYPGQTENVPNRYKDMQICDPPVKWVALGSGRGWSHVEEIIADDSGVKYGQLLNELDKLDLDEDTKCDTIRIEVENAVFVTEEEMEMVASAGDDGLFCGKGKQTAA